MPQENETEEDRENILASETIHFVSGTDSTTFQSLRAQVNLESSLLAQLKAFSKKDGRIARVLFHPKPESSLQVMLLVHQPNVYWRPNRHVSADKTIVLIDGRLLIAYFSSSGSVVDCCELVADGLSCASIAYIPADRFHTMLAVDGPATMVEIISGTFLNNVRSREFHPLFPKVQEHPATVSMIQDFRQSQRSAASPPSNI